MDFPITATFMWVNIVFLLLIIFLGGEPNYTRRITGGFVGQLGIITSS
jgi:hypothetical protein